LPDRNFENALVVNQEHMQEARSMHAFDARHLDVRGSADGKHGPEEYLQTHAVYLNYDLHQQ
jgi:hypothetical protein